MADFVSQLTLLLQQQLDCCAYTADARECLEAANLEPNCCSTATDNRCGYSCPVHNPHKLQHITL